MDNSQYKELFLTETNAHLADIEKGLLSLETPGDDSSVKGVIDDLFRHYHSIKGMCASMGYDVLKEFAHVQEGLLDSFRGSKLTPSPDVVGGLLTSLDAMKSVVDAIEADAERLPDLTEITSKVKALATAEPSSAAAAPASPIEQSGLDNEPPATKSEQKLRIPTSMRVEGKTFDELLRVTGDLLMSLSTLKEDIHKNGTISMRDGAHKLSKNVEELREGILKARMLPFSNLTENLPRAVRDIAKQSQKEVTLELGGGEISLDRSVLEKMGDPLIHLIRNAVDHGIEAPEFREAGGKPKAGTIKVRAHAFMDNAVIEISDDGKGIDVARLRVKAMESGIEPDIVKNMTDEEALLLICTPGLSLKDIVTDVSGRGVGMDIVKESIEAIGGTLHIQSRAGIGSRFLLNMPRTASIMKTFLITVGDEVMGIPTSKIEKVTEVFEEDISNGTVLDNGKEIPVINLASIFNIKHEPKKFYTAMMIRNEKISKGGTPISAILADSVGAELDAFMRPLAGGPYAKLKCATGYTVLGDGRPVFMLDTTNITKIAAGIKL